MRLNSTITVLLSERDMTDLTFAQAFHLLNGILRVRKEVAAEVDVPFDLKATVVQRAINPSGINAEDSRHRRHRVPVRPIAATESPQSDPDTVATP